MQRSAYRRGMGMTARLKGVYSVLFRRQPLDPAKLRAGRLRNVGPTGAGPDHVGEEFKKPKL